MGQFPNLAVIIVKDLVLTIVLNHVLGDKLIVDDCWTNSFFVLLNFLLVFELRLNVRLHGRSIHHLAKSKFKLINYIKLLISVE